MRRLERLVNLLAALIDTNKPLSRQDLCLRVPGYPEETAAFRRAFERDKEALRAMGIPIVVEPLDPDYPDHGDGYRVPREKYALADPGLTHEEMQALAVAASAVKLKSQAATAALWKLGSNADPSESKVTTDVSMADDERLSQFFAACTERRSVTFFYKGSEREIEPHRIAFRNGHWYVTGRDRAHDDTRTYRLDRIEGTIALSEAGNFIQISQAQPWLPTWQMGEDEPTNVEVLIDVDHATLALDQVDARTPVRTNPNGSVTIDLEVTNRDALFSFVLGFLDHAEIVKPVEVRNEFVARLKELAAS